jgi:hypothetical protein
MSNLAGSTPEFEIITENHPSLQADALLRMIFGLTAHPE